MTVSNSTLKAITSDVVGIAYDQHDGLSLNKSGKAWWQHGVELLKAQKVAVVTLAGGQGTRLGSSLPKGLFDIGMPSHKSLFQIQAERLVALSEYIQRQSSIPLVTIPWYVMTSAPTHTETVAFFESNHYFGLDKKSIRFFKQGTKEATDFDGHPIYEAPNKITMAPDGNGGIYKALAKEGILEDMKHRDIEHVHVYCVDNVLVKIADPLFIGYCALKEVQAGLKVVEKQDPKESVGVVCLMENKYAVLEYSEIGQGLAESRDDTNQLTYRFANTANHYFSHQFLESICYTIDDKLTYHIARKKIPYYEAKTGQVIHPIIPNGIKYELFIFDVFSLLTSELGILCVPRDSEFSPLKNASGPDSPSTCRKDLFTLNRRLISRLSQKPISEQLMVDVSPKILYPSSETLPALLLDHRKLDVHDNKVVNQWSDILHDA